MTGRGGDEQEAWHCFRLQEVLPQGLKASSRVLQAKELGTTMREAATRVFSNSSGSYSSNVNLAVENSSWSDEQQLQEMYLKRKSFAFNSDRLAFFPNRSGIPLASQGYPGSEVVQSPSLTADSGAQHLWLQAWKCGRLSAASHTARNLAQPPGSKACSPPGFTGTALMNCHTTAGLALAARRAGTCLRAQ